MIIPRFSSEIKISSFFDPRGIKYFRKSIDVDNCFFYDSATSGIYSFLKSLQLPLGTIVGVPLYSCSSVWHAVYHSGYKIKFIDIEITPTGYLFNDNSLSNIDILIFIHYFGFHYDLSQIRAKYPKLIIISDCTHKNLLLDDKDNISDIKIYSFNFHKPIVAGQGGVVKINTVYNKFDSSLQKLAMQQENIPKYYFNKCIKLFYKTFLKNIIYSKIIYNILFNYIKRKEMIFYQPVVDKDIKPKKLCFMNSVILGNQLDSNNHNEELTTNYFLLPSECRLKVDKNSQLSYFPIFYKNRNEKDDFISISKDLNLDIFVLWEKYLINARYYGFKDHNYKNDLKFLFLPEQLFLDKNKELLKQFVKRIQR